MVIWIISQFFYPDNFRINDIAAQLAAEGHSVRVLTGLPDYETSKVPREYRWFRRRREEHRGVSIRRVTVTSRRSGIFWRMCSYASFVGSGCLWALFTPQTDGDVIFVNETSPIFQVIPGIVLRWRTKKPLILYCYDLWPESMKAWKVKESSLMFRMVKEISGWICRKCDLVAITSRPFREYLIEVCGVDAGRIVYLPQYAEDQFAHMIGQYEENGCIDFLFAGNLGAVQDVDCILRAAAVVETARRFRIHLVGDGVEREALEALAADLGLGDRVVFHGRHPQAEMDRFYRMADCFLLTLRGGDFIGKTLPGKAQGYLSAGKPILAAIDGAGRELILEAGCGEVVPAGDYLALAARMKVMAEDFPRYREMGLAGRRFYEAHFTKEQFMSSLLELLETPERGR